MLNLHRAERADGLVAALADLLRKPPADPLAPELVAVPTRGMERWLTQRLSTRLGVTGGGRDGVCANVRFPSPRQLVQDAVAAACGFDPEADPWLPERAVWSLLAVVDECLGEPWLGLLARHLGDGTDELRRARRLSAVRHLAALFDAYSLDRPAMVRGWAAGEGGHWQAELWRRLRGRIGAPSPAERSEAAGQNLRERPEAAELPQRLAVFGLTRLPVAHLTVLRALAARRDVHLMLLHPSPALWAAVAEATAGRPRVVARAHDPTTALPANRLLASWGRDARELQLLIGPAGDELADHHHPGADDAGREPTLLARLQRDVRDDAPPPGEPLAGEADPRPLLAPADSSLQLHACHGRARQVEVMRDAIVHELARDPTLEPRDVIVMCPDIEAFAPLIHAAFEAGEDLSGDGDDAGAGGQRPPQLRVRLADRSLRQVNPVLGVVAQLVELAGQRLTASQVLDLADREPVRRRFRLDDEDLSRVEDWVADSGIRWGLDAAHRAPFKLDRLPAGTFRAGLDRLLVGVAMTEEDGRLFRGVLPVDDVGSGSIDLAGRFSELVDRLQAALDSFAGSQPVDAWAEALAAAADALTATTPSQAWQRFELQRILDDVVEEARSGEAVAASGLTLPEVRALLADRLRGRPTRANFRTGHLTICTLVPMRSVPHRVVCLLGLDDAAFPRRTPRDGDDLIADKPHVGDRDARSEDRQQLLDALMAAGEKLIVTYTGNDERTNAERPPAVPVGELLDVVDQTVRTPEGAPASRAVITRHPLQPFDPRNFEPGRLRAGEPWSYDGVVLSGARALAASRTEPEPFLTGALEAAREPVLDVSDLVRFAERPVRAFLRRRLGIVVSESTDELENALPIELDGLEAWQIAERVLAARLGGAEVEDALRAEQARGFLPPGRLADAVTSQLGPRVQALAAMAEQLVGGPVRPDSLDVRVELDGGRLLTGTVSGLCASRLVHVTYSRLSPRHRLAAWVRWLALTAAHPGQALEAVTIGRLRRGGDHHAGLSVARLRLPGDTAAARAQEARARLEVLLDLFDRGMREPLPLYCQTSAAWALAARAGGKPVPAARGQWESRFEHDREDREPEHRLVLGRIAPFDELLEEMPRADERGEGWFEDEPTRLGRYARRLWAGVLGCEELEDL